MQQSQNYNSTIAAIAERIKDMREIAGFTAQEMAEKTGTTVEQYIKYESGKEDFPFYFLHKCSIIFGIDTTAILEGNTPKLRNYSVTRSGDGQVMVNEGNIEIRNLAPQFKGKISEPLWVRYRYDASQQDQPMQMHTHAGQEFDYVISGHLKVQVGKHTEILGPGDSIYYNSSTPHGEMAVGGEDCIFCAVVLPGEDATQEDIALTHAPVQKHLRLLCEDFIKCKEDEQGNLVSVSFENEDKYNFAFDTIDRIADEYPDKLAMLHVDKNMAETRLTFGDIKKLSNRAANYFVNLGIKKGDKVMLVLKRHYQFWISMLALQKIGAISILATNQLLTHDFTYRFEKAGVRAVIATADEKVAHYIEEAEKEYGGLEIKMLVGGKREGWHDFNTEYKMFTGKFERTEDSPCGEDLMLMFFSSGTTGYPKIVSHCYKYALGHYITAKYWHCCERDGLHFTISDTGWAKSLWGKFFGQWLCEGAIFVYDFDRFDAHNILPMFAKYNITTFCAPPTMLRMLIKEDISKYDLSSIHHMTTAGEALNPEVFKQFKKATGISICEGFGQTETTVVIGTLRGTPCRTGSMGKPSPLYDVVLLDSEDKEVAPGENGEICIRVADGAPCGLFKGYYNDPETNARVWHDGYYHTGDVAWQDEDGYLWYVGRTDDVIKSSGYRIGPFEIENVVMELPYVLECGVCAAPDEVRGQVVKAVIVLVKGTEGTDELKKEIQNYVKTHTAPYKYPRIVEFRESLPKTISGKIIRNKL